MTRSSGLHGIVVSDAGYRAEGGSFLRITPTVQQRRPVQLGWSTDRQRAALHACCIASCVTVDSPRPASQSDLSCKRG
jgi:hypothetical protein